MVRNITQVSVLMSIEQWATLPLRVEPSVPMEVNLLLELAVVGKATAVPLPLMAVLFMLMVVKMLLVSAARMVNILTNMITLTNVKASTYIY